MQARFVQITDLMNDYCRQVLNEEYAELATYTAAALCRKRPSPLASGKIAAWACAILYALGSVNGLFDKENSLHIQHNDLPKAFDSSPSNNRAKVKKIRDLLDIHLFDHRWQIKSRLATQDTIWMITLNGFIVDARTLPIELQEIAYEKGLIPYVFSKNDQIIA